MLAAALLAGAVLLVPSAVAGGITGPTTIAVGFGSVWVGLGSGEVVRLDARTGRETARLKGGPTGFVHGLAVGHGALWVLRGRVSAARSTYRYVAGREGDRQLDLVHARRWQECCLGRR